LKGEWPINGMRRKKIALSDYVIRNDESTMVIRQVLEVHNKIIQNSKFKIQN